MIPEEIDLGLRIDEDRLHALNLPVEDMALEQLSSNLETCYLEREGTDDWNLCPRELIENFEIEKTHAKRVQGVDLSFPIHICHFRDRWIILDGVHRFTQAVMAGKETILVKKVPAESLSSIGREPV